MTKKPPKIDAIDKLSHKLCQAKAAIIAIRATHDGCLDGRFDMPDIEIENLLWGVQGWLDEAEEAVSAACDEWRKEYVKLKGDAPPAKPDPLRGFKLVYDIDKKNADS